MLFLSLVKGGGFRSDEDLPRHLSKLALGFVAKLTPTGCKFARGKPLKIKRRGEMLIHSPDVYRFSFLVFAFLFFFFWQALLTYIPAIDQSLARGTGIGPGAVGRLWRAHLSERGSREAIASDPRAGTGHPTYGRACSGAQGCPAHTLFTCRLRIPL